MPSYYVKVMALDDKLNEREVARFVWKGGSHPVEIISSDPELKADLNRYLEGIPNRQGTGWLDRTGGLELLRMLPAVFSGSRMYALDPQLS